MVRKPHHVLTRPAALAAVSAIIGGSAVAAQAAPAAAVPTNAMNSWELAACALEPGACIIVYASSRASITDTVDRFGYDRDGTRSNAFTHSSWNARMSVLLGRSTASTFATAHERPITSGNPPGTSFTNRAERMDLCNNNRGRQIVGNWDILTLDQLTPVGKLERAAKSLRTNPSSSDVLMPNRSCNGGKLVLIEKNNGVLIT